MSRPKALWKVYDKMCREYKKKYKQPEVWKSVVINGLDTNLMVSNYGRVFNSDKNKIPNVYLSNKHFRVCVQLSSGESVPMIGTYRLVAMMFIPIPQKYIDMGYTMDMLVVDHKRDGDADNFDDNTVWNLQWLTYRENTSKASKCGYREAFPIGFRHDLNELIKSGADNKAVFKMCKEKYGYDMEEVKPMVQKQRRRLGYILKEHTEHDKEFTKKLDEMIRNGMSNDDIIKETELSEEPIDRARRLLDYRRSQLGVAANVSKYFNNEDNEILNMMIANGAKNAEIIKYFHLEKLPLEDFKKVYATIASRRSAYKKKTKRST